MIQLEAGSCTDVGLFRSVNEDSVLVAERIFLVADGMGGYAAGDVASQAVVAEFSEIPTGGDSVATQWVLDALDRANARIRLSVAGGTTVAGAAVVAEAGMPYWLIFNIGDSRVYQSADGRVTQITVDHSMVQEMVDSGELTVEAAQNHPQRNIITRAVGSDDAPRADLWLLPVLHGQRLMLCSDGVSSELPQTRILELVADGSSAQTVANRIVAEALDHGGRDNVSAIVVDVMAVDGPAGPLSNEATVVRHLPIDDATRPRALLAGGGTP